MSRAMRATALLMALVASTVHAEFDFRTTMTGVWDGFLRVGNGPEEVAKFNLTVSTPDALHGELSVLRHGSFRLVELWTLAFAQGSNSTGVLVAHVAEGADDDASEFGAGSPGAPALHCAFSIAAVGPLAAASMPLAPPPPPPAAGDGDGAAGPAPPAACAWSIAIQKTATSAGGRGRGGRASTSFVLVAAGGADAAAAGGASDDGDFADAPARLAPARAAAGIRRADAPGAQGGVMGLLHKYGQFGAIGALVAVQLVFKVFMKRGRVAAMASPGGLQAAVAARRVVRDANLAAAGLAPPPAPAAPAAPGAALAAEEAKKDR